MVDLAFIEPDWPVPNTIFALSTTRSGGHSRPPWADFNLGQHVGDEPTAVLANRALLQARLPRRSAEPNWLQQVHGNRVVRAEAAESDPVADACWTDRKGAVCAVLTGDCLPVLFCSRLGDRVAAVHAGWRGLLGGVLEAAIAAMGIDPAHLLAWLGPAIGPGAFEVGPEVRSAYLADAASVTQAATEACFVESVLRPGYYFADLFQLARIRLVACGLTEVHGGGICTFSDPDRFFSYRRDGQTGRMATLVVMA